MKIKIETDQENKKLLDKIFAQKTNRIGKIDNLNKKIVTVSDTGQEIEYLEIFIIDEKQINFKISVPFRVNQWSLLGKILINFGADLNEMKELEIEDFLKPSMFVNYDIKQSTNNYYQIVLSSLKPKND